MRRRCPFGGMARTNVLSVCKIVFDKRGPTGFHSMRPSMSSLVILPLEVRHQSGSVGATYMIKMLNGDLVASVKILWIWSRLAISSR